MKNYIYSIILIHFFITFSNGQNSPCNTASTLCLSSGSATFPNVINSFNSPAGVEYSCLGSHINEQWFYINVETAGNLSFEISQQTANNSILDTDFVVWGPFTSQTCDPSYLINSNVINCSYSAFSPESFTLNNVLPGQYYTLLVTNGSNLSGNITITQTNYGQPNSGTTNCDIQCYLNLGPDVILCPNTEFNLTASISDATYQWSSSNEGILPFTSQSILVSPSQTTTYTVVANKQGCIENATDSITITVPATLIYQEPDNLIKCSSTGEAIFNLYSTIPLILGNLNPDNYYVAFFNSELDAMTMSFAISNPNSFLVTNNQTIYFGIEDINGFSCVYTGQFDAIVLPPENPNLSATISQQTITINAIGNGNYQYQLDNGVFQNSNVFENVSIGNHVINVTSTNGCGSSTLNITITPLAPTAVSPQYFNTGATLQDVVVDGENINWYASATDKQNMANQASTPLPITTLLIDGNTYYATQTLSGIESLIRTPVLTYVSSLSNSDREFVNLNYFPNPVKNNLTISNTSLIDSIEITSVLGQKILSLKVKSLQTEIDMSELSKGIYFVKVISGGQEKTIKIVKE
ncbi:T9SS type A sorting domain-containing protein [Flavobacterium sp.]|uniref:T9SS type A sorting domain-containing protein n=1 Tax=Flavobacterium sp. TaxID=239 RepID=UPI002B4AD080|nr:T9SS type A sorting domain-containing protein [Flavobacterium sp.]HLP63478.1 T9SS type A sorting domain-containing protein [Flavobacterium sp.]